jgi:hypothetical protein
MRRGQAATVQTYLLACWLLMLPNLRKQTLAGCVASPPCDMMGYLLADRCCVSCLLSCFLCLSRGEELLQPRQHLDTHIRNL